MYTNAFDKHQPITVIVSGASGMIGAALVAHLRSRGHTVRRLVRATNDSGPGDIQWRPDEGELDPAAMEGCDAIVHLAGASIAQRWTSSHKRQIRESRVNGTALIARTVEAMRRKPRVVLSGSAIGFYGDRDDELLYERSASGTGFLASVVRDWEAAAQPIQGSGARLVLLRTGMVLSPSGGALQKLLPPFKLGLGGPMGSGHQWMSWIALQDHVRAMEYCMLTDTVRGPVNLVSPNPVPNAAFATSLGAALHRPAFVPTPGFVLELMFGEMAVETILAGQRATPGVLLEPGCAGTEPTLDGALRSLLSSAT